LTSALDGGVCSASRPGRFTRQRNSTYYPLDRRLGGLQSQSEHGGEEKNSQLLLGIEPATIQPIAFLGGLTIVSHDKNEVEYR